MRFVVRKMPAQHPCRGGEGHVHNLCARCQHSRRTQHGRVLLVAPSKLQGARWPALNRLRWLRGYRGAYTLPSFACGIHPHIATHLHSPPALWCPPAVHMPSRPSPRASCRVINVLIMPTCSVVSTSGLAAEVSTPLALSTFSASFRPVCKTRGETLNAGVAVRCTGTHGGRSAQHLLSLLQARLRN